MRRLSVSLLIVVTACAGGGGAWPSLARRPIEGPAPTNTGPRKCATAMSGPASCLPVPIPAEAAPPSPPAAVAIDDLPARLTVIDRDLSDAATRLAAQRSTATAAAAAAHGSRPEGEAWAKAQLELTALDRVGSQIDDIRSRLDAIAGTLAAASAGGTDVGVPLSTTGRLIGRAMTLQSDYDRAAAALR